MKAVRALYNTRGFFRSLAIEYIDLPSFMQIPTVPVVDVGIEGHMTVIVETVAESGKME